MPNRVKRVNGEHRPRRLHVGEPISNDLRQSEQLKVGTEALLISVNTQVSNFC